MWSREAIRSASRRNIVNTYVWTAAGGFFAETTGTTDQVTETTTGSYTFNGTIGGHFSVGFEVLGQGCKFGVEASMGTGYSVTRSKSKDATRTFSLEVSCAPLSAATTTVLTTKFAALVPYADAVIGRLAAHYNLPRRPWTPPSS